jgi:ubiquitin
MEEMAVYVLAHDGRSFLVNASPQDTILQLKEKIYASEDIPVEDQQLLFGDTLLGDALPLYDYINRESTPRLSIRLQSGPSAKFDARYKILVKRLMGTTFTVDVGSSDTIDMVKRKIQDQEKIPCDQQRLIYTAHELIDTYTIQHYHINKESTIHLICRQVIQLTIRTDDNQTINKIVQSTGSVLTIKEMIAGTHVEWPIDKQCLMIGEIELNDDKPIYEYNIDNNSSISLVRRQVAPMASTTRATSVLPTSTKGYRFTERMGRNFATTKRRYAGANSAIYRACLADSSISGDWAIKIVYNLDDSCTARGALEPHQSELGLYRRLPPHPNIMIPNQWFIDSIPKQLPDWDADHSFVNSSSTLFMVMELMPLSLDDVLQHRAKSFEAFTVYEILHLVLQMMAAIGHLQKSQMVHSDIKPDNILIRLPSDVTRDSALINLDQPGIEFVLSDFGKLHSVTKPFLFDDSSHVRKYSI